MNKRRTALATSLTLLAALGGTAATVQPAAATAADCAGGAHGFVDIPDTLTGTRAPVANNPVVLFGTAANGILARLEYGSVGGRTSGWAHLYATGTQRLLNSDMVWMDWTVNNGATWLQCGPFLANGLQSKTSASKQTYSSAAYRFRACGKIINGTWGCTAWW